jgi:hypothetical protein
MAGQKPGTLRETKEEKMNDINSMADFKALLNIVRSENRLTPADKVFHYDLSIPQILRTIPPEQPQWIRDFKNIAYLVKGYPMPSEDGPIKLIQDFCAVEGLAWEINEQLNTIRFYRKYSRPLPLSMDRQDWHSRGID